MEAVIPLLRETRKVREAEFSRHENQQILEYNARRGELKKLAERTHECVETIEKNLNNVTCHKHAISKVVHESKRCNGLPISNKHHKQTLAFVNDVVTALNNAEDLYSKSDAENNGDTCSLSTNVQSCAQSTSTVFKGTKSAVDKVEMLMENIHIILDPYNDDEPDLERSIFDV